MDKEKTEKVKEVQAKTSKEIKAMLRPEFEKDPDKFYPVNTFKKIGFSRNQCPHCKHYYWRHSEKQDTCGDSNCLGQYTFIGKGTGIGRKGKKITYADAWEGFRKSLTTARIPCTAIERYPVVARWRKDVDYVAAGIYCFQPYCVTGELDPPANPLICPQFAVRFNDLDNIGLTGRHYSGFIMLGIQVFNYPNKFTFFKEECVEFNYRWLTEELGIDPDEITFTENVWCGGGNCGPCVEYFIGGLEIGNMVFMQYKVFHDGTREDLPVTVIDTGIGLERIAWLINGSATSYMDTFKHSFDYIIEKLNVKIDEEVWNKFGPYSCLLDIDEAEDIEKTWELISEKTGIKKEKVMEGISTIKDIYIILDHIRTVFMIINDGSLPSNVGGGSNVRNILRRVFSILKKHSWDKSIGIKEIMEIINRHIMDMEGIYGKFDINRNMEEILQLELTRWLTTDDEQKGKLDKLLKKKGGMTIDDWILAMQTYGIPADRISEVGKIPIPSNLYYEISQREERTVKLADQILYSTSHLKETDSIFYKDQNLNEFDANILEVFTNAEKGEFKGKNNIVILDKSAFYPTSGGQQNDTGFMTIEGNKYEVINVEKIGKCTLHYLKTPLPNDKESYKGKTVHGEIDMKRRRQLMCHHTATHIIFASCKRVLGPHVWQHSAKKTPEMAHLDITHYKGLTFEEQMKIQEMANKIVLEGHSISKGFINKAEAEKKYGFVLYQGGVVPGNELRVVRIGNIEEGRNFPVDAEACCGTHADNTSQVGFIKIIKTKRISDGVVRLYFVAYERSLNELSEDAKVINQLMEMWGIERNLIYDTANRFFTDCKKLQTKSKNQSIQLINYQIKSALNDPNVKGISFIKSEEESCQMYISVCPNFVKEFIEKKRGVIFYNEGFIYALIGDKTLIDEKKFKTACEGMKADEKGKFSYSCKDQITQGKKNKIKDIYQITCFSTLKLDKVVEKFKELGFTEIQN
ncbi:MAG: alanine--tRNA ligase [archaeon]|nr:alanine--tRNA ligase [archaeon]